MKNLMEEVAKILGVELEEEFEIRGYNYNPYTLTRCGLFDRDYDTTRHFLLQQLLVGEIEIAKPLLTKEEKEYLENVLRPYKNNIEKIRVCFGVERFLRIVIKRGTIQEQFGLPYILEGDLQFKKLENGNCYTPEELKLFEGED